MKHLNSNLLCAVAIKTTGPNAQKHEILEIAVIPLTATLTVNKVVLPFNIIMKPEKIERAEYSLENELTMKCMESGCDKYDGAEIFTAWYNKLGLRGNKQIMVLSHNWASKIDFIREWLQPTAFNDFFSHEYRDTQVIGLYINDRFDNKNELCPFPKSRLGYMCAMAKSEYAQRVPTVIDECAATINLYRSLVQTQIF